MAENYPIIPPGRVKPAEDGLPPQLRRVAALLHRPNKLIAHDLGISEGTVKIHVRRIMDRLGAANRTAAALLAAGIEIPMGGGRS